MPVSNIEFLGYEESPIGAIGLRRRELLSEPGTVITEITLDHMMLMSSCNVASEEALSRRALEIHGGDRLEVLVGGLGLGHTAAAALASDRVARLEVVELLPPVIGWLEAGLLPLSGSLRADPRFSVSRGDVYAQLLAPPSAPLRDLILVDVDHSPDELLAEGSAPFYTEAGLLRAGRHLAPGGLLGIWSYAESPAFEAALRRVFREVTVEPVDFYNRLVGEEERNLLYLARDPDTGEPAPRASLRA